MLGPSRRSFAVLPLLLGLFACGSEDEFTASVAGKYAVALTNGKTTCDWPNWKEGEEGQVSFTITQEAKALTGQLELPPNVALVFNLIFGTDDFKGSIKGNTFSMTKAGKGLTQGNCAYSFNATVDGTQNGDSIAGTISYDTVTNGNPDCDAVECSATQKFNGSRPPQ